MRYLFTLFLVLSAIGADAQMCIHHFSFDSDDTAYQSRFFIDTTNPNNTWQIGQPHKTIFNAAYSLPNVIVTDTANNYPDNDTSSFIIKAYRGYFGYAGPWIDLSFLYQLDKDTGDTAFIEVSADSGATWNPFYSNQALDTTNGWENFFSSHMGALPNDIPFSSRDIYFRFTFISDSVTSAKEGWMIDDICIDFWYEQSVKGVYNNDIISIYPNPSDGHIQLRHDSFAKPASIRVIDMSGQKVYEMNVIPVDGNIDLPLPDGIYMLRYMDGQNIAVKKLVIQH